MHATMSASAVIAASRQTAGLSSDADATEPSHHAVRRACQTWAGTLAQGEPGLEDVPTMLRQRGQYALAQVHSMQLAYDLMPRSGA